jgi:G3E family GTPase
VIIEASGIATPAGVLDALESYPVQTVTGIETVTVVDPVRFEALYEVLTPLIESQITGADRVVVTKVDQATPEEVDLALRTIQVLAPAVPMYLVDAAREESVAPFLADLALPAGAAAVHGVRSTAAPREARP